MKICKKCNVYLEEDVCPLCKNTSSPIKDIKLKSALVGYPLIKKNLSIKSVFLKFYLTIAIISSIILLTLDYHIFSSFSWSLIGLSSIILGYIILRTCLYNLYSTFTKITLSLFSIYVFTCFLDYNLGFEKWSLIYLFPSAILLEEFIIVIFMIIYRNNFQHFIISQLVCLIFSFLSFSIGSNFILSIICISVCSLLFFATLIVGGFRAHDEVSRRFHITSSN